MNSKTLVLALLASLSTGCGWVNTGGSATLNDPEPTGTIVASAPFSPIAGVSVSGTVTIYNVSSGTYIIRLAGLVAPAETGLSIVPVVNGQSVTSLSLRATTGTQNYSLTSGVASPRWDKVKLHSAPANRDYAEALFTNN